MASTGRIGPLSLSLVICPELAISSATMIEDSPQYILRQIEKDEGIRDQPTPNPRARFTAVTIWLVLTQIAGAAILVPWFLVLMVGMLFVNPTDLRDILFSAAYLSYPLILGFSTALAWKNRAANRMARACLTSSIPIAASLFWLWFSTHVI